MTSLTTAGTPAAAAAAAAAAAPMKGISLDLGRMARAMTSVTQRWDALHVAGTNGKGSVCTYLSALCRQSRITNGLFTSPYLVEPRDAIKIDATPISRAAYARFRQAILDDEQQRLARDPPPPPEDGQPVRLTEFELGTLIAFSAFDEAGVRAGIVEVGLGGRLDSTNALTRKKVTVITKIGLDHQRLLGDTLPLIAREKAGIMMGGVPCVVDGSNPPEVLDVFRSHAAGVGAPLHLTTAQDGLLETLYAAEVMPHQAQNMACAITAFRLAYPEHALSVEEALPLLKSTIHLGRLSSLDVSKAFPGRSGLPVLVDGAHNPQSAETLARYVDKYSRSNGQPVTWVVAVSQQDGKDAEGMLRTLTSPGDSVACVAFSRRPTMPWVEPVKPALLQEMLARLGITATSFDETDPTEGSLAAGMAEAAASQGPIVVTGSLYLVGDAYRLYGEPVQESK